MNKYTVKYLLLPFRRFFRLGSSEFEPEDDECTDGKHSVDQNNKDNIGDDPEGILQAKLGEGAFSGTSFLAQIAIGDLAAFELVQGHSSVGIFDWRNVLDPHQV